VAADSRAVVCLMHMQGEPRIMQDAPYYDDVVGEVHRFLSDRVLACQFAGIDKKRIVIDPGFGFGKTLEHNLLLLARLEQFSEIAPVMAGLSRKSMIASLTGQQAVDRRIHGSVAAALIAVQRGAAIVRVHDVAATRDALKVWQGVAALPAMTRKSPTAAKPGLWDDD